MKKHILIAIRYSLLIKNTKNWELARDNNFEEYKKSLFNEKRLTFRERAFELITLASLSTIFKNKNNDIEFVVVVLTSDSLPQKNKEFLQRMENKYPFLHVRFFKEDSSPYSIMYNEVFEKVEENECYATVRLDDDDALSLAWFNELQKYISPEFVGHIISLYSGYIAKVEDDFSISEINDYNFRFSAAGLAAVGIKKSNLPIFNIYQCGSHTKVDLKYPSILLGDDKYVITTVHNDNDSKRKMLPGLGDGIKVAEALNKFGIKTTQKSIAIVC